MAPRTKPNQKRPRPNQRRERRQPRVPLTARLRVWLERWRVRWNAWRPALRILGQLLLFVVMVAGAAGVYRLLERYVHTAPAFATRVIEVDGLERLDRTDVLAAAGLALGRNIFEVDAEEARTRLASHPWIASARVERRLPDSYRLHVVERVPVSLLALDALYLVSDDGTVFKRLESGDPGDFPIITGVDPERFRTEEAYRSSVVVHAVALLHEYRLAGLWKQEPISEIYVEADQGLALYVGDDATCIRLGQGPYHDKLQRLRKVLERLARRKVRATYVYLDNVRRPDRVTVKLQ